MSLPSSSNAQSAPGSGPDNSPKTKSAAEINTAAVGRHKSFFDTKLWIVIYCTIVSTVLMLLCTRSSFLYPYNNWDDANSYFSMGKSMFHEIMIYRDIFDQKGPYLYFLYGLASLISEKTFLGVYILEVILSTLDLLGMYAILRLYNVRRLTAIVLLPLTLAVMFASKSFYWGGAAEEICLPFLIWPLYWTLLHLKTRGSTFYSYKNIFAAGLCAGVVAAIKFTILGYFFAYMVIVMLVCLFGRGDASFGSRIGRFLRSCGIFLLGMFLPIVPWLIYFGIRGALDDWYHVYIYTNVFIYSTFGANTKHETLYDKVYNMAKILYWLILDNIQYFSLIVLGGLWLLLRRGAIWFERIAVILLFGFAFLGIYIGGATLSYYAIPFTAFAVLGSCCIGRLIDLICIKYRGRFSVFSGSNSDENIEISTKCRESSPVFALLPVLSVLASLVVIYIFSLNSYYLKYSKEDVFLKHFAEDIEASSGKFLDSDIPDKELTLLNYNCLDCGLYTVAGIYPSCYWFQTQTLPIDDVYEEQYRYMREGLTDYVVVRNEYPDLIFEQYEILDTFHQVMGDVEEDYTLFIHK